MHGGWLPVQTQDQQQLALRVRQHQRCQHCEWESGACSRAVVFRRQLLLEAAQAATMDRLNSNSSSCCSSSSQLGRLRAPHTAAAAHQVVSQVMVSPALQCMRSSSRQQQCRRLLQIAAAAHRLRAESLAVWAAPPATWAAPKLPRQRQRQQHQGQLAQHMAMQCCCLVRPGTAAPLAHMLLLVVSGG
jgi:hypothetical protein